jgi:hypothetical protein
MMDDALTWNSFRKRDRQREPQQVLPATGATARTGGDDHDEPILIAIVGGPVMAEMAQSALRDAGIPAFVKRDSIGAVYGLAVGALAAAEVWVPRPLAEQAEDVLVGIGVL